jgi:hypothetical protein
MLEKALRLLALLETLLQHPSLKGRLTLKGGTAINLFLFDVPRLSVDIDLNYVGAAERGAMLADRPRVEQAARAVFEREDLRVRRAPKMDEHAGGKWLLRYASALGGEANLEVDLNFMFRVPSGSYEAFDRANSDLSGSTLCLSWTIANLQPASSPLSSRARQAGIFSMLTSSCYPTISITTSCERHSWLTQR